MHASRGQGENRSRPFTKALESMLWDGKLDDQGTQGSGRGLPHGPLTPGPEGMEEQHPYRDLSTLHCSHSHPTSTEMPGTLLLPYLPSPLCRQRDKHPNSVFLMKRHFQMLLRKWISMNEPMRIMDATDRMRTHGKQFKVTAKENTFQRFNHCQVRQHTGRKARMGGRSRF